MKLKWPRISAKRIEKIKQSVKGFAGLFYFAFACSLISYPSYEYFTKLIEDPAVGSLGPLLAILAIFLSLTSVCFSWSNSLPAIEPYAAKKKSVRSRAEFLLFSTILYLLSLTFTFLLRNFEFIISKSSVNYKPLHALWENITEFSFCFAMLSFFGALYGVVKQLGNVVD